MSWFNKKHRTDAADATLPFDSDEFNALDRLTLRAAVKLSRRSFLKKAGVGTAAAVGIGIAGLTTQSAEASSCTVYVGTCPPDSFCIPCGSGHTQNKYVYYNKYRCPDGSYECRVSSVSYGTCGTCLT